MAVPLLASRAQWERLSKKGGWVGSGREVEQPRKWSPDVQVHSHFPWLSTPPPPHVLLLLLLPCWPATVPPDVQVVRVELADFDVPPDQTTYVCTWFKPPSDRKYHIYNVDMVTTYRLASGDCGDGDGGGGSSSGTGGANGGSSSGADRGGGDDDGSFPVPPAAITSFIT